MVKLKHFILFIVLFQSSSIFTQNNVEYPELNNYCKFGFSAGWVLFNEAKLSNQYGPYTVEPKPIPSFSFGITYNLPLHRKWSFETGLFFVNEPSLYVDYVILKKDLPIDFTSNSVNKTREYIMYSTSIPFILNYKFKIGEKSYLHCQVGMKAMLLYPNTSELGHMIVVNDTFTYNTFYMQSESPDAFLQGSFVSGIGYSIALNYLLLRANLTYTSNFQNTNEGFYQFLNLRESADSGGNYTLSGDHFAFTITANFRKSKKRLEKQKLKM